MVSLAFGVLIGTLLGGVGGLLGVSWELFDVLFMFI